MSKNHGLATLSLLALAVLATAQTATLGEALGGSSNTPPKSTMFGDARGGSGALKGADSLDNRVANFMLLRDPRVRAELKVTSAQRDAMNRFADAHRARMEAFAHQEQQLKVDPKSIRADDPVIAGSKQRLRDDVIGVLNPKQLRRLRELTLQTLGPPVLFDPVVAKRVGLSSDQRERIRSIFEDFKSYAHTATSDVAKKVLAPYRGKKPKSRDEADALRSEAQEKLQSAEKKISPQLTAAKKRMESKILAILTPRQREAWESLKGKKFRA